MMNVAYTFFYCALASSISRYESIIRSLTSVYRVERFERVQNGFLRCVGYKNRIIEYS